MECTFESLPFLFPERERASLLAWRQEAVQRERRHAARRLEQFQELQRQIAARLARLKEEPARRLPSSSSLQDSLTHVTSTQHHMLGDALSLTHEGGPENIFEDPPSLEPSLQIFNPPQHFKTAREKADKTLTTEMAQLRLIKNSPAPAPPPGDVYAKLTALGRGFLTRRLLQSAKVSSLVKTIKDGSEVLAGISGPVSQQDTALRDRVHTQLQLARLTLHEILELPVGERMAYIAHSRLLRQQKRERVSAGPTVSRGRLSTATKKAIERRQKSSIPVSQTHKSPVKLAKPVSMQERLKLPRDRSTGREGARVCPVGHSKRTIQTPRPTNVAVQDKIKARQAKTAVHSRGSGQGNRLDSPTPLSGQASKLGQTRSGQQKPSTGRYRPQRQPLVMPVQGRSAKKKH